MIAGTRVRNSCTGQLGIRLIVLSVLFGGVAGCAQVSAPPFTLSATAPVEATVPSGWETHTSPGQCGYAISHPPNMEGASQGTYSWIVNPLASDPGGPVWNFVYISVIPDEFQSGGDEIIYNYDPVEAETLLNMQVGESKPLRDDPDTAQWFTYTRLPDTVLSNQAAQAYENAQPWEFPMGTKEIRYYFQANGCIYLVGGYLDNTGSNQLAGINEELFDQIVATFRLTP